MATKPVSSTTTTLPPRSPLVSTAARLRSLSPPAPAPPPVVALDKPLNGTVVDAKSLRATPPPPSSKDIPPPRAVSEQPSSDLPEAEPDDDGGDDEADDEADEEDPINMEIFNQIIELDEDDEDLEFSTGMVEAYFAQADKTFTDMDEALQGKKLGELSALGHFLKGSSAALGITKVQNTCEEIQHYGKKEDVKASRELTEADALGRIQVCVKRGKGEYKVARAWLEAWFKKAKATNE